MTGDLEREPPRRTSADDAFAARLEERPDETLQSIRLSRGSRTPRPRAALKSPPAASGAVRRIVVTSPVPAPLQKALDERRLGANWDAAEMVSDWAGFRASCSAC